MENRQLTVTEIGEFISQRSCERRFKLSFNKRAEARKLRFAERLFNALDPVLQLEGKKREREWEESLQKAGLSCITSKINQGSEHKQMLSGFLDAVRSLRSEQMAYGREIGIEADIGYFHVVGRIDFCIIRWEGGRPRIRLVECKASRRDRTYQRIQVAVYGIMARSQLVGRRIGGISLSPEDVECVVARIDESTNEEQAILELPILDLGQEEADVRRLLADSGVFYRVSTTSLEELDYHLDAKCDTCVFNVHCFPESARQRRIQLIGVEPNVIRSLASVGIRTIDELAAMSLDGSEAAALRAIPGFRHSLVALLEKARVRCSTLPGGRTVGIHEVQALPNNPTSQLPEHLIQEHQMVRVYLTVHYDYVENRIGALAAHVTTSDGQIDTPWQNVDGGWRPTPEVLERVENGQDLATGQAAYTHQPLHGIDVTRYKASPWSGRYEEDTGAERELLQGFFQDLVDAIADEARSGKAPIHFYLWSRSEMSRLMEACSRVGSGLLGHLRELLGCREPLEQLIFSCLEDEVHNRYALGWTGRGLVVATSLSWYGRRYHWKRILGGAEVELDRVFTQDIFDFKTDLWLDQENEWVERQTPSATPHKFEIRSRFYDTLTAPYWRAVWGILPDPDTVDNNKIANAIRRYNQAADRGRLTAYLKARAHALRWIEDAIIYKNPEIQKPLLEIPHLIQFSLGINTTAEAAIDFLRIDQHVKVTDWIASHLIPPAFRLPAGRTLPISNIRCVGRYQLEARIDLTGYDMTLEALKNHCTIQERSFVRFTPCQSDRSQGQTMGQLLRLGSTCIVTRLDWEDGDVLLSVLPNFNADLYRLASYGYENQELVCEHGTLDESPSDFVAGRVESRLRVLGAHHVCSWLNPIEPEVPAQVLLSKDALARLKELVEAIRLPSGNRMAAEQVEAALQGLSTRVQLLQGPPGTGKTVATAAAILLRIVARLQTGNIVLVGSNTHAAVNNLLDRIAQLIPSFLEEARRLGVAAPIIRLVKIESSADSDRPAQPMVHLVAGRMRLRDFRSLTQEQVAIIGGTTGSLLKMAEKLDGFAAFGRRHGGFQSTTLVVDEASMMVFPSFLALSTMVGLDGEIMLTGDHRQLAPIMAHDWEREDRPPVVLYQPYVSAYDAVRNISQTGRLEAEAVHLSALRYSFRLPAIIRELIARLYRRDRIELTGRPAIKRVAPDNVLNVWASIWRDVGGLFLVVHSERNSTLNNPLEVEIVLEIMRASDTLAADSTAIVTPHRAQRNLLSERLAPFLGGGQPIGIIDTVEKLQGGERPNIIVSATESDPASIAARVEFILDLNRSNVAFSRAAERLIVVCAESLLDYVPVEVDDYDSTMLWKSLREYCSERVDTVIVSGYEVRVYTPPQAAVLEAISTD